MFNLAGVGQDPEMSNRVVGSMTGSTAAPTPTAGTSPDFSLAAVGANTAGAFPADSGLTDRTGTSGAVGSYTGPDDIYGWEDGVKSGTVNRLDNGRFWVYRDGMGNVLGEIDKSMLAQNPASRAEREATLSTHEPVIDPVPDPFPEPDPLPAGGIELGQELEGGLLPEETEDISAIASQIAGLRAAGANIDADALEVILGKINSDTVLTDSEFKSLTPELQSTVPEDLHPTQVTPVVSLVEEPELGEELEGELLLEEELDQDSEEELVVEEPVVSLVEEPELGQDLEVDLAETELPLAIAADDTELVGGLPLVDAYHAMKVGEGPVLTEAQISQLPPELLVEARAWMAANVDGPRQKAVAGPVDEVELGQDLEADLSAEEGVPSPAAKTAGGKRPQSEFWTKLYEEEDQQRKQREGQTINDLPLSDETKELLREIYGEEALLFGSPEHIELMALGEMQNRLRLEEEAEGEQEWDEYLAQLKPRPTGEMDAYWGGIPDSSGLQQGPTYVEDPLNERAFGLGGEGKPDVQAAWEVWEELPAYEKNQNWGTTRWPAGDFGEWYRLEWPRHSQWQDPGLHGRYDFPIIEDRSPWSAPPVMWNAPGRQRSPWDDL
jgi:hypothetical protein